MACSSDLFIWFRKQYTAQFNKICILILFKKEEYKNSAIVCVRGINLTKRRYSFISDKESSQKYVDFCELLSYNMKGGLLREIRTN